MTTAEARDALQGAAVGYFLAGETYEAFAFLHDAAVDYAKTIGPPKIDGRPAKDAWAPGKTVRLCAKCGCTFAGGEHATLCADCAYEEKKL